MAPLPLALYLCNSQNSLQWGRRCHSCICNPELRDLSAALVRKMRCYTLNTWTQLPGAELHVQDRVIVYVAWHTSRGVKLARDRDALASVPLHITAARSCGTTSACNCNEFASVLASFPTTDKTTLTDGRTWICGHGLHTRLDLHPQRSQQLRICMSMETWHGAARWTCSHRQVNCDALVDACARQVASTACSGQIAGGAFTPLMMESYIQLGLEALQFLAVLAEAGVSPLPQQGQSNVDGKIKS
jgi:hypothetical protein